jgi:hypothetical protein
MENNSDNLTEEELRMIQSDPQLQAMINADSGMSAPSAPDRESTLKLLNEVRNESREQINKISRTGNLEQSELGTLPIDVRHYLNIANYAESEWGPGNLATEYLNRKAEIILSTSLSKKGFFLNLAVTQRKINKTMGSPVREEKTGLFSQTVRVEGEQE